MSISHLLEDFGSLAQGTPVSLTDVSLEEQKLEAFEKGYQAGWDDSTQSGSDDSRRISADFEQNLQDLSFTYQEAHVASLNALKPLLDQMVSTVLPAMVQKTLGSQISELLHDLAKKHGSQPIEIVVAPANSATIGDFLNQSTQQDIKLVEEPSLADGQVYIRFGSQEREINLNEVLTSIDQAVVGFFEEAQRETA